MRARGTCSRPRPRPAASTRASTGTSAVPPARATTTRSRAARRAQHGVDALWRNRRLRLPDRRDQPHRGHGALGRHLQCRLPRLERQPLRLRHALQLFLRHQLPRQDARRAGQRLLPGLLRHRRRRSQQSSPLSALNAPAARTTTDHNRRQLDILGARFQPRYKLFSGNELLFGLDWERSWLRSDRYRPAARR